MAHKEYRADSLNEIRFTKRLGLENWIGGIGGMIIYDINDTTVLCRDHKYDNITVVTIIGESHRIGETKSMLEKKTNLELEEKDFFVIQ